MCQPNLKEKKTNSLFTDIFNEYISGEKKQLIWDFFLTFSRFECALKNSGFITANATPNWDKYIKSIRADFKKDKTQDLEKAVYYIIQNPPKKQVIVEKQLCWKVRSFQNEDEIQKLNLLIRGIRNNLFHGGKFNGKHEVDISRNYKLLNSSIIILNEWLSLNEKVKQNFVEPI